MEKKIDLMHKMFGMGDGLCKDCGHLIRIKPGERSNRGYHKCAVYGISGSVATDWKIGNVGCGLFPGKPYAGDKCIVSLTQRGPRREAGEVPGQIMLEV